MDNSGVRGQVGKSWVRGTLDELESTLGPERAASLVGKMMAVIPAGYDELNWPKTAALDLPIVDRLSHPGGDDMATAMIQFVEEDADVWRFRVYRRGDKIALADLLPLLDQLGFRALDERSFPFEVNDDVTVWLHDVGAVAPAGVEMDDERRASVQSTFMAQFRGEIEVDRLNSLVAGAGLSSRRVEILRAYVRYLRQIGFPFSQQFVETVLLRYGRIAADLTELFDALFNPARAGSSDADRARTSVLGALDGVPALDDDRTLRTLLALIDATVRTNAYRQADGGGSRPVLSFKLDTSKVPDLPLPRPMFEIWVCSPRVEGVHLRNGRIARGGIRWSDRREDFRTEVLGLVKAQIVKNAVIVPTGAKGGFVLKRPPASSEDLRAEGVACYREYIAGLLDVTDNIVDGEVVPPPQTVRRDGDDPYLVVAADKGTATFSDVANEISAAYGFWLGDAFASGGSVGYDHKAVGITARGAWESVRRHVRVLGKDVDTDPLTMVGIGDMSGDVFGNGLLRSPHVRLVAAFDHRHVFIDPDPDPAESFAERRRLFNLARSSWADYDPALLSAGGGVYPRSLKSIQISPQAQAVLGAERATFTPNELVSAILRAPVDVLWNGGIGTYVKGLTETHADVGDRANDGLRVNGGELRCRVVGEGGNLGFTQLGRIEFASQGGLINTDAIDNSAGVDCSDHEVNIKVLFGPVVASGRMTMAERDALLEEMTDEVAELVLDDNRAQTLALTVARAQSNPMVNVHARYLNLLEGEGWLNRALEFLPTDKQLAERQTMGGGLTTPEFAVLMAYTKSTNSTELSTSEVPDDPYLEPDLLRYFPTVLQQRFADDIRSHRLRREIITTQISNQMSNISGISFDHRMHEETGSGVADVIRAWVATRDILGVDEMWAEVDGLGTSIKVETMIELLLDIRRMADRSTLWLLRHRRPPIDIAAAVGLYREPLRRILAMEDAVVGKMRDRLFSIEAARLAAGVPERIAQRTAMCPLAHTGFDIATLAARRGLTVEHVAQEYWTMFELLDLDWLWTSVANLPRSNRWQTQARAALRDELQAALTDLADDALFVGSAQQWYAANEATISRSTAMFTELRRLDAQDMTTLSVALRQMHNLSMITEGPP